MPIGQPDSIGIDVGWLGFPNIEPNTLCFFAGTLSARQEARKGYLIDGVAINGVSGGPVFHCPNPENIQIIGCVSAYDDAAALRKHIEMILALVDKALPKGRK